MKFFDDRNKKNNWWNRNYFFAGTMIVILINILLFAFAGDDWESKIVPINDLEHNWGTLFYFAPTFRMSFNAFSHSSWQHVLLNMLCFFVVGLYLERKVGTFGILGFVVFGAYVSGLSVATNNLSIHSHGFSGVNYFIYAYILVDYIFSFQKNKRNKTNIILGAIVIALIYLAMCYNDETSFPFSWYPHDLLYNLGHYSSFVAGIIIGMFAQIIQFKTRADISNNSNTEN